MELKNVFEQIQAAEKAGNLSPEDKRRLEEQAAEKGLQALFKVRMSPLTVPHPTRIPTSLFFLDKGNETRN